MPGDHDLEERVATLIRTVLHVDAPASDADLIDLGLLDSLALVSLIAEIEVDLGFQLPLDDFDVDSFRSVERIAAFLAASQTSRGAA